MDFYKSNDKKLDDLKLINIIPKYQTITNSKFIKFDINECFIKKFIIKNKNTLIIRQQLSNIRITQKSILYKKCTKEILKFSILNF